MIGTDSGAFGAQRLLEQATDLRGPNEPQLDLLNPSLAHLEAFSRFERALSDVLPYAIAWWNDVVRALVQRGLSEHDAEITARENRPAGPAAHPRVVHVVRTYFLLCQHLNTRTTATKQILPEHFILTWLREAGHDDAFDVLSSMPYWPLGQDKLGHWT